MAVTPYLSTLTVPAATTVSVPATDELTVAPGRLILFRLYVPPGPRGEISLWLRHGTVHIAPVPPATWDQLDDDVVEFPLDRPIPPGEVRFTLCGTSPNANFQHKIDWELLVETREPEPVSTPYGRLVERLAGVFGS